MLEVAILQRRLASYRLPLYEGLRATCPDIRLTVFCGERDEGKGTSGIPLTGDDPDFVRRVRTSRFGLAGRKLLFQRSVVREILGARYDVAVFEGSLSILSHAVLLGLRRLKSQKNVIWLKGWPNAAEEPRIKRFLKRLFLRLADGYVVYGESSRRSLARYRVTGESITVVQNTVAVDDLLRLDEEAFGAPAHDLAVGAVLRSGKQVILNVGRLVTKKAVSDLIEAYAVLTETGGAENMQLVVAGGGPERPNLEELARTLGIDATFLGRVDDHDLTLLLGNAVVCVFPGAVGLALNQAMAAGRAVVCADEEGPDSELLVHEMNGLRYEKGDVDALARAIAQVVSRADLRLKLGSKARDTILKHATMKNMITQFAGAIHKAVAPNPSR